MIVNLFAGPGGWCVAADRLGLGPNVGFELDAAACATRAAAGHRTVRADVSAFPVEALSGHVTAVVASPVCTTFSAAGKRAGNAVTDALDSSIRDIFEGCQTRAAHRREMARMLRRSWWPSPKMTRAERSAAIWKAVRSASLVVEPARYIHACKPEWVALEQVPSVLPLWQVYADELGKLGYSTWCGILNSADYGVPQTRLRAILIASRCRPVSRPEATHYDPRKGMQLFGTPWVSMADALGWGATGRAAPTVTAVGAATGGAEPFGHRDRDALAAERDSGRWVLHTNRDQRPDGSRQTADPRSAPAPAPAPAPALTAKSGGQWKLRLDTQAKATLPRSADEPAPTIQFAHRANLAAWVRERPATTVQGDPRVGRPGHKDRAGGEAQFEVDSVRITVEEAALLQSFPADYPWRGSKTKRFEQCGNAVPPLLAEHVVAMASGVSRAERAA